MSDDDMRKYRQGQLAKRMQEEAGELLQSQEDQIVDQVMRHLNAGETLDPQFAIQQWLALYSVRRFRRTLTHREQEAVSSGKRLTDGAETLG